MFETAAKEAYRLTGEIIGKYGARLTGSQSCLKAADDLAELARGHADATYTEDFSVHPTAFLGFIRLMLVLYIAAVIALPFIPWLSFAFLLAGAIVLVSDFFLYKGLTDLCYPKTTGRNVWATLEPAGQVERQLIVSGHHDSAHVFNFYVDKPELYGRRLYGGMGVYFAFLLGSLFMAIWSPSLAPRLIVTTIFTIGFSLAAPLWRFASKEGTPGAGDNLAASTAAMEILKEFKARKERGEGLSSTRVIFASFDAEEAGLRGARAWAQAHTELLAKTPSWNYNMDCIYSASDARFLTSDINGSVSLNGKMAQACADIAKTQGVTVAVEPIAFLTGGTDAAELTKKGVRATTLIAMSWSNASRSASYHTPSDTVEAVGLDALELAIGVGVKFAERLDSGACD